MCRVKKVKPLTREQYLKKFSRAVRWRLPPQEAEEAIADYRELILRPDRKYYKLTPAGRERLEMLRADWQHMRNAISYFGVD